MGTTRPGSIKKWSAVLLIVRVFAPDEELARGILAPRLAPEPAHAGFERESRAAGRLDELFGGPQAHLFAPLLLTASRVGVTNVLADRLPFLDESAPLLDLDALVRAHAVRNQSATQQRGVDEVQDPQTVTVQHACDLGQDRQIALTIKVAERSEQLDHCVKGPLGIGQLTRIALLQATAQEARSVKQTGTIEQVLRPVQSLHRMPTLGQRQGVTPLAAAQVQDAPT